MLIDILKAAQGGQESAKLELLKTFQPLLRKYTFLLKEGEDGHSDLVLFLLEMAVGLDLPPSAVA